MLLLIIIFIILITTLFFKSNNQQIEHYYNILPYQYRDNIYKCLTKECTTKETMKCYDWCKNWAEPGAQEQCRTHCFDLSDLEFENIRWNDYFWSIRLNDFQKYRGYRKNNDYESTYPNIYKKGDPRFGKHLVPQVSYQCDARTQLPLCPPKNPKSMIIPDNNIY